VSRKPLGAGIGGAAGYYGTDDSGGAAVAAAAGGAVIGALLCKQPEPYKATPAPKPAPKPQPKVVPTPVVADPDSDGDGVPDSRDDCPGTPEKVSVDDHGCPEIPNLSGVHFAHDKANLAAEATVILDQAASILESNPHVRVEIVGFTDSKGSDDYNQRLSERRANSARDYLAGRGVAGNRMTVSGQGEKAPVADNATSAGRQANRRVELTARPTK
jgi:OOP family OmpA-OmpF porin